jgi:hypothetical protein
MGFECRGESTVAIPPFMAWCDGEIHPGGRFVSNGAQVPWFNKCN